MKNLKAAAGTISARIGELLREKTNITVGIDGRCASGKSSLAELLRAELGCAVVHADDFFLRPEQRTPERLSDVGGNLDRERLLCEVLIPLKSGKTVEYRPFDCSKMMLGAPRVLPRSSVTLVEGSYCLHPELAPYYDLTVFLSVDAQEQLRRLTKRESEAGLRAFVEKWIPLEEKYIAATATEHRCELVFKS